VEQIRFRAVETTEFCRNTSVSLPSMITAQSLALNLEPSLMRPKSPKNAAPATTSSDAVSIALKRMHQSVITEDVPQDFMDLLSAIARKTDDRENPQ
jgi:hypothetical protein